MSWGSFVLATFYWELCQAMEPDKMSIAGCLLLLHSWAWWNHRSSYVGLPKQLEDIRSLLD
ncbi:serine/threonine-protein phosphatase 7 long form-like protein [Gossypium australe]|uniref:Serine/threonine-protein phosphatase 7 long form-like protein n=1 Tax=Gossypium australe TaxID=47621 RepID=A0A5B6WEA2_9ROSI|nr:serine/threonine-protein phosphatase 7 long form-like protein [Gossypium australe]